LNWFVQFLLYFSLISNSYLGLQSESELIEERDEEMRNQYYDPIEHFPDKIDQLLDALNRVRYFTFFYCSLH
jgi:hypothetical protein